MECPCAVEGIRDPRCKDRGMCGDTDPLTFMDREHLRQSRNMLERDARRIREDADRHLPSAFKRS